MLTGLITDGLISVFCHIAEFLKGQVTWSVLLSFLKYNTTWLHLSCCAQKSTARCLSSNHDQIIHRQAVWWRSYFVSAKIRHVTAHLLRTRGLCSGQDVNITVVFLSWAVKLASLSSINRHRHTSFCVVIQKEYRSDETAHNKVFGNLSNWVKMSVNWHFCWVFKMYFILLLLLYFLLALQPV